MKEGRKERKENWRGGEIKWKEGEKEDVIFSIRNDGKYLLLEGTLTSITLTSRLDIHSERSLTEAW